MYDRACSRENSCFFLFCMPYLLRPSVFRPANVDFLGLHPPFLALRFAVSARDALTGPVRPIVSGMRDHISVESLMMDGK
jgi:hypothetical protein